MSNTASIEGALFRVIESVRSEYNAALAQCGLSMDRPKVSVLRPEPDSYSSEIQIYIIRRGDRQIVDCLEFLAFKDGKPQVTDDELCIWLGEQVEALVKEAT